MRRTVRFLILLGCIVLVGAGPVASDVDAIEDHPPVAIDRIDDFSIIELGGVQLDLRLSVGETLAVPFLLPEGFRAQGEPFWFIQRVAGQVDVSPNAKGHWNLVSSINGFTAVSINYEAARGVTTVESVSLLGGSQQRTESNGSFREFEENYSRDGAFRSGRSNLLMFKLNNRRDDNVGTISVLLDGAESGVSTTVVDPYEVSIGLLNEYVVAQPGETFSIPFRLRSRGQRPPSDYEVLVSLPKGLKLVGEPVKYFKGTAGEIEGSFLAMAEAEGVFPVRLKVKSDYNRTGGTVLISIKKEPLRSNLLWAGGASIAAMLVFTITRGVRGRAGRR